MGMRPGLTERLEVTEAEAGRRVDAVLADAFGVSRSLLADWFSRGLVRAESRPGRRPRCGHPAGRRDPGLRRGVGPGRRPRVRRRGRDLRRRRPGHGPAAA